MKLISMREYCLQWQDKSLGSEEDLTNRYGCIMCYANFLSEPLALGMFVPCDLGGKVLTEPKKENYKAHFPNITDLQADTNYKRDLEQYQQAKSRVVFEGCELSKNIANIIDKVLIEELIEFDLTITPEAINRHGI